MMFQVIPTSFRCLIAIGCLSLSACGTESPIPGTEGSPSAQDAPEDAKGQDQGGGVDASGISSGQASSEMAADDKIKIDRDLENYRSQVQGCYRLSLNKGDTAGTLTLIFDIDITGQTMNVRTSTTGTLESGLTDCVEAAVARWSFKELKKDYSNIQMKYVLESSDAAEEMETVAGDESSLGGSPKTPVLASDQTKVQRRLGVYERQVQSCYRLSLANGEFAGTLTLTFDIDVYGSTENVRVTTAGTWDDGFAACVASSVEGWTFKGLTKQYSNIETSYVLSADETVRE